jgi:hypothetical protein
MTKWEYHVQFARPWPDTELERELNRFGEMGWEAVSILPVTDEQWGPGLQVVYRKPKPSN